MKSAGWMALASMVRRCFWIWYCTYDNEFKTKEKLNLTQG